MTKITESLIAYGWTNFGETWIADSEQVLLLFEPGRYPVAYFPETDVSSHALERTDHTIQHPDLGLDILVCGPGGRAHRNTRSVAAHRAAGPRERTAGTGGASPWQAMDAFYEEEERIVGHDADSYHRIDIRQTSRHLVVRHHDRTIADTTITVRRWLTCISRASRKAHGRLICSRAMRRDG